MDFAQDIALKAWNFAAKAHINQKYPGKDLPYIVHIGSVTMELMAALIDSSSGVDMKLAVQCAILHDTIEDTAVTYEQLKDEFGLLVAEGVDALTKNSSLNKTERMSDSLRRIKLQPQAVWMVKMADRISNLQPPPSFWDKPKILQYGNESEIILQELGAANKILAHRLQYKIKEYGFFV